MKICIAALIINLTSSWTAFDQSTLNRSKIRCIELYSLPCVSKFSKHKDNHYEVVCGNYGDSGVGGKSFTIILRTSGSNKSCVSKEMRSTMELIDSLVPRRSTSIGICGL